MAGKCSMPQLVSPPALARETSLGTPSPGFQDVVRAGCSETPWFASGSPACPVRSGSTTLMAMQRSSVICQGGLGVHLAAATRQTHCSSTHLPGFCKVEKDELFRIDSRACEVPSRRVEPNAASPIWQQTRKGAKDTGGTVSCDVEEVDRKCLHPATRRPRI